MARTTRKSMGRQGVAVPPSVIELMLSLRAQGLSYGEIRTEVRRRLNYNINTDTTVMRLIRKSNPETTALAEATEELALAKRRLDQELMEVGPEKVLAKLAGAGNSLLSLLTEAADNMRGRTKDMKACDLRYVTDALEAAADLSARFSCLDAPPKIPGPPLRTTPHTPDNAEETTDASERISDAELIDAARAAGHPELVGTPPASGS